MNLIKRNGVRETVGVLTSALLSVVFSWGFSVGSAQAQCDGSETQILTASDYGWGDDFGSALSIDGDVSVVGAYWHHLGWKQAVGAAYIYRRSGGSWVEEQEITGSDAAEWDSCGYSVACSGDVIFVGSPWHDTGPGPTGGVNAGAVYVFHYDGNSWSEVQVLTASDGDPDDRFGMSVAVDGEVAAVGAEYDGGTGSVYIYRNQGGVWVEEQKLLASDGMPDDYFGCQVSVSGETLIAGAFGTDDSGSQSGSAYLFRYQGGTWVEEQKLLAGDGAVEDDFGLSVGVNQTVAVIGAYRDDDLGDGSGAAYVFRDQGGSWVLEQKLTASDETSHDAFGRSVAVRDDVVAVGAPYAGPGYSGNGAAYLFRFDGSTWLEEQKLWASDGEDKDYFGEDVATSGNDTLVGAYGYDIEHEQEGAAYVFATTALGLDVEPEQVSAGDTISFTTCRAQPGTTALLAAVEVNGFPFFAWVASGPVDPGGQWVLTAPVPPGLGGMTVAFRSYALLPSGQVAAGNREWVGFL